MTDKDEIRSLQTKIKSLEFQIKQMTDFKEENRSLKKGSELIRKDIEKVFNEKKEIQNSIGPVFSTFKKLITINQTRYKQISSSYNNDIIARMEKDNKYFAEKIYLMEKKSNELINDIFQKVNQYLANKQSGENNILDINTLKFNLSNILKETNQIFEEIKVILELSSQSIEDEEEETLRNIRMIEIIIQEVDRIMEFVPIDQSIRNNILGQLGINAINYPLNTPTLKIILTSMQEVKRKRQTKLKSLLDQIKTMSAKLLEKQSEIKNEIASVIKILINYGQSKCQNDETTNTSLEDIFTSAKEKGENNIKLFDKEVCDRLSKEINDFKQKIEEDAKKAEDILTKAKKEFFDTWAQIKSKCCDDLLYHAKNSINYHFLPKLGNYQKYEEITNLLKEKIYIPECNIVNFGLINCTDCLKKIKEDVVPRKCIIPIGKNNDYKERLDEILVKETNLLYYSNDEEDLLNISYNVRNFIEKLTYVDNIDIIFPVFVIHYNDYSEFEKETNNIRRFIINCLKLKAAFVFFFGKIKSKDLKATNKKIKTWIDENDSIKEILKDSNYELSPELCYNFDRIKDGVELEMEKLTNFKKGTKKIINKDSKNELKYEYFDKMWHVSNSHSIATDLDSIRNAQDEELSRSRLAGSIMDFSILCLNLDKKPKERQLKEKESNAIYQGIKNILDKIYEQELVKDLNNFLDDLNKKKLFELYLKREKLKGDIDIKYNTSLLTEENDENKTQKIIGEEISKLIKKNLEKEIIKLVGRLIWSQVFEKYCPKFYILMEKGFKIPDNFEEYLIESLNPPKK